MAIYLNTNFAENRSGFEHLSGSYFIGNNHD